MPTGRPSGTAFFAAEEEANASEMISNMQLFGSDPKGLYDLDREYLARVYNVPSPLAAE